MGALLNWNISFVFVFMCTFYCGVYSSNNYHHKQQHTCKNVQNEFQELNIGDKNLVPDNPVHVAHLAVCHKGLRHPGQRLCCNNGTVDKYHTAAHKYLMDSLHSGTAFLKKFLMDKLKDYEKSTELFLEEAKNRTSILLTQMHNIPWTKHHDAVRDFFTHLDKYIIGEKDTLHDSVHTFFSRLFPSVFYYTLNDPSFLQMDNEYHDCLSNHSDQIRPFGKVPQNLQKKLQHSLRRSRSFVTLLTDIVAVMETTDNLHVDTDCVDAVTRLQYCSRCHGYTEVQPCRGFCLNVMRGCLAKLSDISHAWDSLVSSFRNLVINMKTSRTSSLKTVLMSIDKSVFDGILEAMQGGPRIHASVLKHCVNSTKTKTDKHPYERKIDTSLMIQPAKELSHISLEEVVESVSKRLDDSLGMYNRIADGICGNRMIYEEKMTSETCWNGTDIARYLSEVPEANVFNQAKSNKEVRVTVTDQQSLSNVKTRLHDMTSDMTSLIRDDMMQGDEPSEDYNQMVYSSGDSKNTFVITDDEDFGPGSGSGSGDDHVVTHTDERPTDTNIDNGTGNETGDKKPNSAPRQSFSSILLLSLTTMYYYFAFH